MREEDQLQQPLTPEELMQELRFKATELLLREEWQESVQVYTQFINLCRDQISDKSHQNHPDPDLLAKLKKSLCLALSNRAEALSRLRDLTEALKDCDQALKIESTHFKSLVCKGKILLSLNRYSMALDCFKTAILDPQASGNLETLNGYVQKCKKLEFQSRTGAFDLSDWILSRFRGKSPELAEYTGPVQIKRSELSGRGLFATKNIDAGTLLLVTKAIATERGILSSEDSGENAQLVMWKNFAPEMSLFRPEAEGIGGLNEKLDKVRILSVLDVNSLVEDSVSAKVFGRNSDYYGVGLWILASFINHSCNPNARRLHVGDHMLVHASRDVKAGEEITFAYFDVLSPLSKRKEMSETWGFHCSCRRCKFEEEMCSKQEVKELEIGLERGIDVGSAIFRLEEGMRRWMVRGKGKGYMRASFWAAYSEAYGSEKSMRRWGRRIPAVDIVVDSVAEAVGCDERVLKVFMQTFKGNGLSVMDMEKSLKLGRGVHGKVVKKQQALRSLLDLGTHDA
ncbi:SET domain-containing family protein [Salix suchowensis]|nr:SET domain-containing family protein [Salix suchowensis]